MALSKDSARQLSIAVAAVAIVLLARASISDRSISINAPLAPLLVGVALAAFLAGFRSGVLATVAAGCAGAYWYLSGGEFQDDSSSFPTHLAIFAASGLGVSYVAGLIYSARQQSALRLHAADVERELQQRLSQEVERRAKVEMALREREERIRMAVESANIGTWDWNLVTDEVVVCDRCKQLFGFRPLESPKVPEYVARVHDDDREEMQDNMAGALASDSDGQYEFDYRVVWPDGTSRWVLAKGQALFDGEGAQRRVVRFIGTVMDISERRQAELAIRQANENFRVVATDAPVGIFQTDCFGRCLFVNQWWCDITGARPEEALGEGWRQFLHPADSDRITREWEQAVRERRSHTSEFRFLSRHAGTREVVTSATVLLDVTGAVRSYVGSVVDVTERKAAENVVRASQAKLQAILDNTTSVIYMKDLEGRYQLINRRYEELFHVTQEEITGATDSSIFPPDTVSAFRTNDRLVEHTGKAIEFEEVAPHNDGLHTYFTVKFPIRDGQGKITAVGGISTDITDRKKTLDALETEQELLRHTIVEQDQERQLITLEIHDGLVQYATGALMQLEALRDQMPTHALEDRVQHIVGLLQTTVAEGRRIINGIRTPVLDGLGVVAAVEQLIDQQRRDGIEYQLVEGQRLGRMSPQLEETLYRITQEALTNVNKHSRSKKVRIELARRGNSVHLEVRDWGVGFRAANGSKSGHGLKGMSKRAKIAGGHCTISSSPGEGTSISVDLPFQSRN